MAITLEQLGPLTVEEKYDLIDQLWCSLAGDPSAFVLTDDQAAELDRRAEQINKDGAKGESWEVVKQRILASRQVNS